MREFGIVAGIDMRLSEIEIMIGSDVERAYQLLREFNAIELTEDHHARIHDLNRACILERNEPWRDGWMSKADRYRDDVMAADRANRLHLECSAQNAYP